MASSQPVGTIREAVGVFEDLPSIEAAIDELLSNGFDRAEISLLAAKGAVEETLGHKYRQVEDLEDDPDAPRAAYVSRESIGNAEGALAGGLFYVGAAAAAGAVFASGGTLAAAIAASVLAGGAGGAIGSVLASIFGKHHADYLQTQLDRGGLLLWVRTWDAEHESRATNILSKHSAHDVHIHDLPAYGAGAMAASVPNP